MADIDKFFDEELKQIQVDSRAATSSAARELYEDVQHQIRRNFVNPSLAFQKGVKLHEYEGGAYVRLSPILASHAEETNLRGNPNLWILLPDGKRLGFKKIGKNFTWKNLKFRYGDKLSFVAVNDGHVVLYRSRGGVVPVYKIQSSVKTKQRIDFYEKASEIGNKKGLETTRNDRQVNYE